jgi:hypothetical protein
MEAGKKRAWEIGGCHTSVKNKALPGDLVERGNPKVLRTELPGRRTGEIRHT